MRVDGHPGGVYHSQRPVSHLNEPIHEGPRVARSVAAAQGQGIPFVHEHVFDSFIVEYAELCMEERW